MITVGAATHPGKQRQINEDSLMAATGEDAPPGVDGIFAVADGVGGRAAGNVASRIAIEELLAELRATFWARGQTPPEPDLTRALRTGLTKAHGAIAEAAQADGRHGMGSTLTAAVVAGPTMALAHIGDSRAYLLRDNVLRQLTTDHSWVAEQVLSGVLTPTQAASHPQRNVITRALGIGCKLKMDSISLLVGSGDALLLTSDGVHAVVGEAEVRSIVTGLSPGPACQRLVERANELGGPDNSTAIVVKFA